MALKDEFNCYGGFYNIKKDKDIIGECRSVLEIVRKGFDLDTKLDAIAIMMNPGDSSPIQGQPIDINDVTAINSSEDALILTNPDHTQSRIMGIMNDMSWNHVRVINLSDLREKDNNKLKGKIESFEDSLGDIHSIFSDERKDELNKFLISENVPLILAWGTNRHLINLAEMCLNRIEDKRIVGIPSSQSQKLFQHPLTRIEGSSWKKEILKQLKNIN